MPSTEHKFNNAAYSNLISSINAAATTAALVPGGVHALLKGWASSKHLYLTLIDPAGHIEIIRVSAISGDNLTIARGQDGSTARAWPSGTLVTQRMVAANLTGVIQKEAFRSIVVNPNGVYSAVYPGEKVYQSGPAAGERRWWKSTTGTKWRLISGTLYGDEYWDDDGYVHYASEYLVPIFPDPPIPDLWTNVPAVGGWHFEYIDNGIISGTPDGTTGIKSQTQMGVPEKFKLTAATFGVQIIEFRITALGANPQNLGISIYTGDTLIVDEYVIGPDGGEPWAEGWAEGWAEFWPDAWPYLTYSWAWVLAEQISLAQSQDLYAGIRVFWDPEHENPIQDVTIYEVEVQVD